MPDLRFLLAALLVFIRGVVMLLARAAHGPTGGRRVLQLQQVSALHGERQTAHRRLQFSPHGFRFLLVVHLVPRVVRRQLLVLERMANGESNKQIAYNLSIAETTVKAHVSAILRKLSVHNRIQAVLAASNVDFNQYLRR